MVGLAVVADIGASCAGMWAGKGSNDTSLNTAENAQHQLEEHVWNYEYDSSDAAISIQHTTHI